MMELMLPILLPKAPKLIDHRQKILSVGSCFTEHIGNALKDLKFSVLQNPNGILFDPASVCSSFSFQLAAVECRCTPIVAWGSSRTRNEVTRPMPAASATPTVSAREMMVMPSCTSCLAWPTMISSE